LDHLGFFQYDMTKKSFVYCWPSRQYTELPSADRFDLLFFLV